MAAKVMLAKSSGNVGSHSFEFLGWNKQPTLMRFSGPPTQLTKEAAYRRGRCKRLLDADLRS
jgi:hypothetical protein